jgi:hypothetical protein
MSEEPAFTLLVPRKCIDPLARRYGELSRVLPRYSENTLLTAGQQIVAGKNVRGSLEDIFVWKTKGRGRSRLDKNSDGDVFDALRLAVSASTERAAISVLCGLQGVDIPIASAIMTAIRPAQFTVIDFRALEALSQPKVVVSLPYYLRYLAACKAIASEVGCSLRTLDQALWQWSREKGSRSNVSCARR